MCYYNNIQCHSDTRGSWKLNTTMNVGTYSQGYIYTLRTLYSMVDEVVKRWFYIANSIINYTCTCTYRISHNVVPMLVTFMNLYSNILGVS